MLTCWSCVPQVMLTSMNDVQDRIKGLDAGADDYIVKPFAPKELEARVRSLLRRCPPLLLLGHLSVKFCRLSDRYPRILPPLQQLVAEA